MIRILTGLCCLLPLSGLAQFSPDGGQAGSIAIHQDSALWKGWAKEASFRAGLLDIANPALGFISEDLVDNTVGIADGAVLSFGDGGEITLTFDPPIRDGEGFDFVVFENGFSVRDTAGFFELALIEVSSDGEHFVQFAATSLTPDSIGSFGLLDSRKIDGLAGNFSAPYGTPFDLNVLPTSDTLDKTSVKYVRLIDVVGTTNMAYAKTDIDGAAIIDPYPTAFAGGGFDLDAVGAINVQNTVNQVADFKDNSFLKTIVVTKSEIANSAYAKTCYQWFNQFGQATTFDFVDNGFYLVKRVSINCWGESDQLQDLVRIYVSKD